MLCVLIVLLLIFLAFCTVAARTLLPDTNNNIVIDIVASVLHGACLP